MMATAKKLMLFSLALCFIPVAFGNGADSPSVDQLQIDTFGTSTLHGIKEVYPQIILEVIESNDKEPSYVPKLGPLVQKNLADGLTEALRSAGIEIADSFDISNSDSPLNLNITVFVRVTDKPKSPTYIVSVYTEALQSVRLAQDDSIRTFARTWPITPTGLNTRNLLLLNPRTIEQAIKKEVAYQLGFFVRDYLRANPKQTEEINETKKEEIIAKTPISQQQNEPMITGTVLDIPIEGGFYGLLADDGRKYDPENLPEEFKQNGLRVKFKVNPKKGMASIHMWGTIVEIVKIEKL
jgi:hypothetical protein